MQTQLLNFNEHSSGGCRGCHSPWFPALISYFLISVKFCTSNSNPTPPEALPSPIRNLLAPLDSQHTDAATETNADMDIHICISIPHRPFSLQSADANFAISLPKVACSVLVALTADHKPLAVLWPLRDSECRQSCLLFPHVPPPPTNRTACVPQGADNRASDSSPPVSWSNWPQPYSGQASAAWAVLAQLKQEHQASYSPGLNRAE